jgi:peroxiredoxin
VAVANFVTEVDYSQVGPAVGELFPNFELPDADERPVGLHSWRNGRRALVVFYRSAAW